MSMDDTQEAPLLREATVDELIQRYVDPVATYRRLHAFAQAAASAAVAAERARHAVAEAHIASGLAAAEEERDELRSALAAGPAPAGEPVAWMTLTDEGDPAMLFFDRAEAVQYCDDGEQPTPLYEACHAGTPSGWLVVRQDGKDRFVTQSEECANGFVGSGWSKSPLYDQAALDAAVAAERARLAQDVADLHMAQSVNNQNYPADWHDGVDAALAVIRGA